MPSLMERATYRERALRSVTAQTSGAPAVHIVIGMTPWDARNAALAAVETEFTAFLDDDDWWLPNHLEVLLSAQERTGADLVYSRADVSHEGKREPYAIVPFDEKALRSGNYIPISYLVRTELARTAGFPPRESDQPSDWLFLLKLLDLGATFHFEDQTTWVMRRWSGNTHNWPELRGDAA